jgi:uncharacterized protein YndB with AHSA1/START domain
MSKPYNTQVTQLINAPMSKVFAILNDFTQFNDWNPFMAMDPKTVVTLSEKTSGEGATYSWTSKKMGSGSMVFTGVYPESLIMIDMHFMAPSPDTAKVEWRLTHVNNGVEMSWSMSGERGFFGALMVKLLGMDKAMTKHFADGLTRLKALAER